MSVRSMLLVALLCFLLIAVYLNNRGYAALMDAHDALNSRIALLERDNRRQKTVIEVILKETIQQETR